MRKLCGPPYDESHGNATNLGIHLQRSGSASSFRKRWFSLKTQGIEHRQVAVTFGLYSLPFWGV